MEAFTSSKTIQLSHSVQLHHLSTWHITAIYSTVKFCSTKIYYKSPGIFTWALSDQKEKQSGLVRACQ